VASCLNGTESALLTLINQHRANNGRGPFSVSAALNIAAYNHSLDMSDNKLLLALFAKWRHTSRAYDRGWLHCQPDDG
jgi:hypothetical protein